VISLRLRPFLEETISQEQSAFVPGRLITDNALVAFECIHTMRRRKKARKCLCAVKLDMMKAYDRVEWPFLEALMRKLGFLDHMMINLIKCVSSVRFSVKVNGELQPHFIPTRGIRSLPISLFNVCRRAISSPKQLHGRLFLSRFLGV
jgi:hypothetical protein